MGSKKNLNFKFQISNLEIIIFLSLLFFYFLTRLYHLTILPVFCDEAIYIRWAQVMRNEPGLRFLPLSDGKQPLFMWLLMPALKIFSDPLFAGRFVSVMAGLLTMIGLAVLSLLICQKPKLALLAMLLYIFAPFTFFFDRMALVDSLLAAFSVWSLIFAVLLGETRRLDVAMILGMILGGAWLTKSPGMFFVVMAIPAAILSSRFQDHLKLVFLLGVSLVFAFTIYNILRLGPNFHMIAIRNKDYIWSVSEILKHPLDPLIPHLRDIWRYYSAYLTWPVFVLGLAGVLFFRREKLPLLFWWAVPLLGQAAVAKVFTARYILFGVPLFLILAAHLFRSRRSYWFLLFLLPTLYFDWQLWHYPAKAPLPKDERRGYFEDWTAGGGIKEVAEYLKALPKDKGVVVGTEGFFGTLPDGLQIYLEGIPDMSIIGVGQPIVKLSESLKNAKKADDRVYLVVNQSRLKMEKGKNLELVEEYEKPGGDKLLFFEVK